MLQESDKQCNPSSREFPMIYNGMFATKPLLNLLHGNQCDLKIPLIDSYASRRNPGIINFACKIALYPVPCEFTKSTNVHINYLLSLSVVLDC